MSGRVTQPLILTPSITRANLHTTTRQHDLSVSMTSYRGGQREQRDIEVKTESAAPVTPLGNDVQKAAMPLSPSVYSLLTPTLHKFTLPNKVAMVTGYAIFPPRSIRTC